jgi:hypothetical protein
MLLSLYRRGFTLLWCPAGHDDGPFFEGRVLKVAVDELCGVVGYLARERMFRVVNRRLSGGADL